MSDYPVRTVGLGRDFGMVRALDSLAIEIPKGTILTLLGPNGAGKTTLLRVLMGLIEPTRGQAYVLGSPARNQPADVAGRVAYVGDRCEPPWWSTPALLASLHAGAARPFDKSMFEQSCRRRGLSRHRIYGAMSKGQRRWVLAGLALASRPELVLLDEPADGLDPAARRELYDALRDHVNDANATAIVTTHVIADVERIADEVAVIDAGRLVIHAPLEDLRDRARQIDTEGGDSAGDLAGAAAAAGCVQLGQAGDVWMKPAGLGDDELRRRLGAAATIRNVGLEALYLAVAERRPLAATETERVEQQ